MAGNIQSPFAMMAAQTVASGSSPFAGQPIPADDASDLLNDDVGDDQDLSNNEASEPPMAVAPEAPKFTPPSPPAPPPVTPSFAKKDPPITPSLFPKTEPAKPTSFASALSSSSSSTPPAVNSPAVAPSPVISTPAVTPNPVISTPAVAPNPVISTPAVAPNPVISTPAVAQSPVISTPAVAQSPVISTPAVAQSLVTTASVAPEYQEFSLDDPASNAGLFHKLALGLKAKGFVLPTAFKLTQSYQRAFEISRDILGTVAEDKLQALVKEAFGIGALQALFDDKSVTSILVNRGAIAYQKLGDQLSIQDAFVSKESERLIATRLINVLGGKKLTAYATVQGQLGDCFVSVALGQQGLVLSAHRANHAHLEQWVREGRSSQAINALLRLALQSGRKMIICSSNIKAQVEFTAALLRQSYAHARVIQVGVTELLGTEAQWVTLGSDEEDLVTATQLNADCLVIGNQNTFEGNLMLEALSSANAGILLANGHQLQDAIELLKAKADESLISRVDLVVGLKTNAQGKHFVSDIFDIKHALLLVANQQLKQQPEWLTEVASLGFNTNELA